MTKFRVELNLPFFYPEIEAETEEEAEEQAVQIALGELSKIEFADFTTKKISKVR